jgi:hypothetical protein
MFLTRQEVKVLCHQCCLRVPSSLSPSETDDNGECVGKGEENFAGK